MTSASVNNAGLDASIIPAAVKTVSSQNMQKGQDFGKIMDQAAGKTKKDNTFEVKQEVKADTSKPKKTDMDQKPVADNNTVQEKPEQKPIQEETTVDEDVKDAVNQATDELLDEISDELDISQEELIAVLEQLGLQPIDLLQDNNLAQVVATVQGADSLIEIAADSQMYQQLQNLAQTVDTTIEDILAQTGLSEEELMAALEQIKAEQGQTAITEPVKDNILPFEQNVEPEDLEMKQPQQEDDSIPVIKTQTDTQRSAQTTENVTEVSQMTEETHRQAGNQEEENPSYQEGQENLNKFQNSLDENLQVAEQESIPTRTVDTESIMKQLADYVKIQKGTELTEMEMQLHPASLGNVHIQLATKGGVVTAQITTQNEAVKNAIETQVVQLKDNLEEQGVKVEAVEVSVASHQMEKNLDQNGQDHQSQEQDKTTGSIRRIRRSNINLNLYNSDEEALEEASGLDDAARIAMEMMTANGNTMDLLA